uniref:Uncharacterized protein n=1 Tax=Oncorhynchus mykiss TaxID=8022 RepID=A0A8K9XGX3_ONCMY
MPDPVSNCTYNLLYQDLKRFSNNGEHFCKVMTVCQQRYGQFLTSGLNLNYLSVMPRDCRSLLGNSRHPS